MSRPRHTTRRRLQALAVADAVLDLEAALGCPLLRRLDQARGEVDADDGRARRGQQLRDTAAAAAEVEHTLAGARRERIGDRLVQILDRGRDPVEGTVPPHDALP